MIHVPTTLFVLAIVPLVVLGWWLLTDDDKPERN